MTLSNDERGLLSLLVSETAAGRPYLLEEEFEPTPQHEATTALVEQGLVLKVVVKQSGLDRDAITLADYQHAVRLLRDAGSLPEVGELGPRSRPSALSERALA